VENDVHIVGVSSLAAGHLTLVPELKAALTEQGRGDVMIVIGDLPTRHRNRGGRREADRGAERAPRLRRPPSRRVGRPRIGKGFESRVSVVEGRRERWRFQP
jgi:hypothetical protein